MANIAITLGDPSGVGPEVALRALSGFREKGIVPVLIGRKDILEKNYSRFLTGRAPGQPPPTLFEYLPSDALLFLDESRRNRCDRFGQRGQV